MTGIPIIHFQWTQIFIRWRYGEDMDHIILNLANEDIV